MTLFHAIVLGVLQGLAEFLPISSSAHLALAPWLFGWPEPGLAFDVALHVGTLVAVLLYFRREWVTLARAGWHIVMTRRIETPSERMVLFLVIGTIPGGIGGVLLQHAAETTFRTPALIAVALMTLGFLLWLADRVVPERRPLGQLTWRDALLIGVAQLFALVPGVSRSGSTITAARALAIDREAAATFSFLLSMPIIAAAAVFEAPRALAAPGMGAAVMAGVLAAAVSGWLAIHVLLRYVTRHSFGAFALYRLVLGAVVLAVVAFRG
ncbi:MAG TPA: undecaprenyl-diphosphate phosphatase [Gemmatimonadaceae bacterium]|nr:undecaprenyl-diphosphate phosphatase [Gemmatimonadaceae bacterium]